MSSSGSSLSSRGRPRIEYIFAEAPKKKSIPESVKEPSSHEKLKAYNAQNNIIPRKGEVRTLPPIRANAGIELEYRRQLTKQIDAMHKSVVYWLTAAYRANPPELAQDEVPATLLKKSVSALSRRWTREFNKIANESAKKFVSKTYKFTGGSLQDKIKTAGMTVEFKLTPALRDVVQASIHENVSLIRSIPAKYFSDIEQLVMRSVQSGRDLQQLTDDLEARYQITRDRAILIARDQNNKTSASINRARQIDLGITHGIWMHSTAGKVPRPTHVAMNGKTFDVRIGMWDSAVKRYILPGEEINCRCGWKPIIPGF